MTADHSPMNLTCWRILRIELLRGAAPVALAVVLFVGALMMFTSPTSWVGRWMPWAIAIRESLWAIAPLVVACAAWQAGRERRRRIDQHVLSTPRPPWRAFVLAWAAVTLGAVVGLVVIAAVTAVFVAPVASYSGGGWWWIAAVAVPALAAMSALGAAAGRLLPWRATVPVAGFAVFAGLTSTVGYGNSRSGAFLLGPIPRLGDLGEHLHSSVSAQQMVWFSALAATVLLLAVARRRVVAAVPGAAALASAAILLNGPGPQWLADPAANELVCTDGRPSVCMTKANAFLLDDDQFVTRISEKLATKWGDGPDAPGRAVERRDLSYGVYSYDLPSGPQSVDLVFFAGSTLTGSTVWEHVDVYWNDPQKGCYGDIEFTHFAIALQRLYELPKSEQMSWSERFREADCDATAIAALLEELA